MFSLKIKNEYFQIILLQCMLTYSICCADLLGGSHRIIDDRMENSIKGRRIGDNLR